MSEYVSAHQAAARCGVSERTVRRWIARGRLAADKHAGVYRVALEDVGALAAALHGPPADSAADSGHLADDAAAGPASAAADSGHWAALVRDLQAELLRRTEAAAMWQARAEMLGHQLRAIEAPKGPQSPPDANLAAQAPDPPSEPSEPPSDPSPAPTPIPPQPNGGSPWWRRWWRALSVS